MEWSHGFWLTRLVFQRALGVIYLIAFIVALNQFRPLLGEHGLLPAPDFIHAVPFWRSPSLFYLWPKDAAFRGAAWLGIFLSLLVVSGIADGSSQALSAAVWVSLWALYLSFVNVGQTFYAFGWESILLEAGFYAIFLGPRGVKPPALVIWMLRWLLFRVMFGAGLIKLRGDSCWRELTCLDWYFETQPLPNPLSWSFHWAAEWTHHAGVAFNHLAELIAPFGYFAPSAVCGVAGLVTIVFQGFIASSGNLSWLNFLTIVLAIPCFDDRWLGQLLPLKVPAVAPPAPALTGSVWGLSVMTLWLSVRPILNMISPRQVMNASYNPLHLGGTYGAFGSITRERDEIVIEGTDDDALSSSARWREYEFKAKPGDLARRPPQIAPYHLRLDWLMWFAAMRPSCDYYENPWFGTLMVKLLEADPDTLSLLGSDPFGGHAPRFLRALLYRYRFTTPEERRATGNFWDRSLEGAYFPTITRVDGKIMALRQAAPR